MLKREIVQLEDRTLAEIVQRGAFFSIVRFTRGGIDYEILVGNEEFDDYKGNDDDDGELEFDENRPDLHGLP